MGGGKKKWWQPSLYLTKLQGKKVKMAQMVWTGSICWQLWTANRSTRNVYCAPKCPNTEGYVQANKKKLKKKNTRQPECHPKSSKSNWRGRTEVMKLWRLTGILQEGGGGGWLDQNVALVVSPKTCPQKGAVHFRGSESKRKVSLAGLGGSLRDGDPLRASTPHLSPGPG